MKRMPFLFLFFLRFVSSLQEVMAGTHPVPAGFLHDVPLCDGGLPAADRRLPRAQRGGSDRSLLRVGLPGSNAGRLLLLMMHRCV